MSAPHLVRARNSHSDSVNAIHNDVGARANGYRSALVPGGTVFAYLCVPVLAAWGEPWLGSGAMAVTWHRPTYQDDEVEVHAEETGAAATTRRSGASDAGATLAVSARRAGETEVVATGTATLPAQPPPPPAPGPDGTDGPVRLGAGERLRPGLDFVPREITVTAADAGAYLDEVGEPGDLLRRARLVHPAHLQRLASHVLFGHVTFDTSFQVAVTAESQHLGAVGWDTRVRVGCRITAEWEQRGHRWLATECVVTGTDGAAFAVLRRTSIYRLRPRAAGRP